MTWYSAVLFFYSVFYLLLFLFIILHPESLKSSTGYCSLFFYSWGEVKYFPIMIVSILVDYFASLGIEKNRGKKKICKVCMGASLLLNLGMLFFFKYTNFFVENINALAGTHFNGIQLTLPLGISFYTFQTLSYTDRRISWKNKSRTKYREFCRICYAVSTVDCRSNCQIY